MKIDILAAAAELSNENLLARIDVLAGNERSASAELVAHLAVLYGRPAAYAAKGYGSLFAYCTQGLRLSEDAACNRIEAAKACARFPLTLDLLASGSMTLTSVRVLGRHLTDENHRDVLGRAKGMTRPQIDELIAEIAPRPDVPSTMRKLPTPMIAPAATPFLIPAADLEHSPPTEPPAVVTSQVVGPRSIVQPTAPGRYRVQFTIGSGTHEKLRRIQALLRREIPDGDPAVIVDRALTLLLASVEKAKLGATSKPRPKRVIRPETDNEAAKSKPLSRAIPREVKRVAWRREEGQCAFVSADGRRCSERTFLEFHHVQPFARRGPATVENIALRCRRHNQYESELVFGPRRPSHDRDQFGEQDQLSIRTPPRGPSDH